MIIKKLRQLKKELPRVNGIIFYTESTDLHGEENITKIYLNN